MLAENKNIRNDVKSILIIRLSSLGDVLLTTSLVASLRLANPNITIDFVTLNRYEEIYKYNSHINNLFLYDKSFTKSELSELHSDILVANKGKYDVVVDLQNNLRSIRFRYGLGRKILKFKKQRLNKLLLVHLKINRFNVNDSIPQRYFNTASSLMLPDQLPAKLELWNAMDRNHLNDFYTRQHQDKVLRIAIAPGARHFTKRLPERKYVELALQLINLLNARIVLTGGVDDYELCRRIAEAAPEMVENHSRFDSIESTSVLLDSCVILITNDSSPMHIAAARRVPVIAIFGSTVREFGFSPYGVPYKIIERNIRCRPCTHIGRKDCPKGHFDCMEKIETSEIMDAVIEMLDLLQIDHQ